MMKKLFVGALALVLMIAVIPAQASVQEDLNAAISKLNADQQSALLFLLTGASSGAASADDAILDVIKAFGVAAAAGDAEAMMKCVSDDFEHWEFGDKEGLQGAYEALIDEGMFEDIELILDDAEIEIDGDEATIYPVDVEGAFGTATIEYVMVKEGDTWKIIEMDVSGV